MAYKMGFAKCKLLHFFRVALRIDKVTMGGSDSFESGSADQRIIIGELRTN